MQKLGISLQRLDDSDVCLLVSGVVKGSAEAPTINQAKQEAAKKALAVGLKFLTTSLLSSSNSRLFGPTY